LAYFFFHSFKVGFDLAGVCHQYNNKLINLNFNYLFLIFFFLSFM
jgi:hypothetical protein